MADKLTDEQIEAIRDGCEGATSGPWHPGHLGEPGRCQCTSILSETGIMGAVASVHVDNGLKISDGGNDAPPKDQAAANMRHIARCDPGTIRAITSELLEARAEIARLRGARTSELMTDVAIDILTDGEGDTIIFCCKNPDFNGLPNECVIVNSDWTGWENREFRADTRADCLRLAVDAFRVGAGVNGRDVGQVARSALEDGK